MGTNYYLELRENPCPTCGRDTSRDLHIGKSSVGWVFTWRGYRASDSPAGRDLTSPTEWFTYLTEETATRRVIRDEYGDKTYSLADFMSFVASKRDRYTNGDWPDRHEIPGRYGLDVAHVEGDDVLFSEFS